MQRSRLATAACRSSCVAFSSGSSPLVLSFTCHQVQLQFAASALAWRVIQPGCAVQFAGAYDLNQQYVAAAPMLVFVVSARSRREALTGLTRLVLAGLGGGVGDKAAVAVARSCRQLQHLDLSDCSLGSGACVAEIGRLTQLTKLRLEGNAGITRQGLMQLQHLGVDPQPVHSTAVGMIMVAVAAAASR